MRIKAIFLSTTACSLLLPMSPALAQSASDRDSGEIIVTARKRQESILKVPVIQSVLTKDMIDQNQITDLTDIASMTTGIVLGLASLESGTQISLRGVGTTASDPGLDQSVSLNLDGLQLTQGSAYSVGVFDMEQIEVLKGPQALFFGKSSPGGVISIRTADPGDEVEVTGRFGHEFEANEWRGEAILSGPVTDTLGLRLATMYSDHGGFFKNTAQAMPETGAVQPARHFGATKTLFVRGTALFKPTSAFTARLKLNYTRDRQTGGAPYQLYSCPDGKLNYAGVAFFNPADQCKTDGKLNIVDMNPAAFGGLLNNGRPFTNITQKFGTLELNYDIAPELTLTSVTGYYKIRVDALFNGTVSGAAAPALAAEKHLRRKEFTQEVRLNSDFSGPLNFTVGGFYQDGEITNGIRVAGNSIYKFPAILALGSHDVDIESVSFFGQARYRPVPELEIAGGVRWTDEKRSDFAVNGAAFPQVPKLSSKNWSPELTITYTPTDDLTVFGSLKQGYKSGSYNLSVPVGVGQDNSFGDEKVQGGEVGLKTRLADRQVNINLAGYYYKYTGLQVGAYATSSAGLPILRTQNAGAAKVYGLDFDVNYRPSSVPELSLHGAVNWNRARFIDFATAPCWGGQTIAEGCDQLLNPANGRYTAQDLGGAPLPRAPEWQVNIGADYDLALGGNKTLSFGTDGQFSSKYLGTLGRREDFYQKKFFKLSASVALKGPEDRWEFAVIGDNLTNVIRGGFCSSLNYAGGQVFPGAISGAAAKGASGSDEVHCVVDRGRAVWLRLTVRPFGKR